ncbi:MAG TPA: ABC transporter substrate-binding protein [Xanthobacteraceae bacterium]|jgi:ABC-type branched-subunit amino acid transport system substrate-binding protein|nr:ABC transporter substrate-binding protein [Xanthobacteraceae bacterium]
MSIRAAALAISACAIVVAGSHAVIAEDGVSADAVVFGQAAVFSGPASALGQGMRLGIQAAFAEANKKGGVNGRQLKLVTADDGYEPDRSIVQTKKLIQDDKVFALIGPVGTPTSAATQPIATAAQVPFIGPFTGAGFLRNPSLENVVNIRASYEAEAEAWIKHLTEDLKITKIGILYQDDAFGRSGLDGVQKALDKRGLKLVAEGTYERNTVAIKMAVLTLKGAQPDAVVMVGAYKPCAEFIKLAHKLAFKPVFVNISFVGAAALAKELGPDGKGVVVSQVVPFPWDTSLKAVGDYQAAIKSVDPGAKPDFVSLEGYLVGRLAVAALEKAGDSPTREGLLKAIKDGGNFDIGGLSMTFSPTKTEGLGTVFLTVIQGDGTFKPVEKLTM